MSGYIEQDKELQGFALSVRQKSRVNVTDEIAFKRPTWNGIFL